MRGEAEPRRELEAEREKKREAPGPGLASAISAESPKRSPRSTLTKRRKFYSSYFFNERKKKIKANHALYAAQRGGCRRPEGPRPPLPRQRGRFSFPSSAAGGAASGGAGERPAVAEGRSWIYH